ncbi:DUF305 domain-containing protein [Hymenobacter humi]|uniref:DUF305 domain-containing protein n=1 Tax=Hymenobacter humi TaxID=1411620 RepID=A0ABW2UE49_9BACT
MNQATIPTLRGAQTLLLATGLLLGSCRSRSDETQDSHIAQVPVTMMATLHTMAEHSGDLMPGDNLDLYFALLMRENHQAAVSMSALELQQGKDPVLRTIARNIYQAHRQLIPGLDSAIARIQALPPTYPEHTPKTHQFAQLLEAATKGLHPAAHRIIAGGDSTQAPPVQGRKVLKQTPARVTSTATMPLCSCPTTRIPSPWPGPNWNWGGTKTSKSRFSDSYRPTAGNRPGASLAAPAPAEIARLGAATRLW